MNIKKEKILGLENHSLPIPYVELPKVEGNFCQQFMVAFTLPKGDTPCCGYGYVPPTWVDFLPKMI